MPIEISVSIVAAPWRRALSAARWNSAPPQNTTTLVSANEIHCQPSNCSDGTIASSSTGSDSDADTASRTRMRRSVAGGAGTVSAPGSCAR